MQRASLLFALAAGTCAVSACASDPEPIHYTGETRRFVVDAIEVPRTNTVARELAFDLNGNGTKDNQLGMVTSTLAGMGNVTSHADAIIAAGVIESGVEITADDFSNDKTVGVRYLGVDGEPGEVIGGELTGGFLAPAHDAGEAVVHLPVFVDADPTILRLHHARVLLVPDGQGGYHANIGGAVAHEDALAAAYDGIRQMLRTRPSDHVLLYRLLDGAPQDDVLTDEELAKSSLVQALLGPDLRLDGRPLLSIAFRVHLKPCAAGTCRTAPAAASCFDRVKNGSETDVDCGGSCAACAGGFACALPSDCAANACDAGTCALPSCSNGARDGFETDVDCGSSCGNCAIGKSCLSGADCASGQCGAPCNEDDIFCGGFSFDTCRARGL